MIWTSQKFQLMILVLQLKLVVASSVSNNVLCLSRRRVYWFLHLSQRCQWLPFDDPGSTTILEIHPSTTSAQKVRAREDHKRSGASVDPWWSKPIQQPTWFHPQMQLGKQLHKAFVSMVQQVPWSRQIQWCNYQQIQKFHRGNARRGK